MQIAIDGYSSTGKSSLAKRLANELGWLFIDTGAMYRAVTYYALQNGYFDSKDWESLLVKDLENIHLEFKEIKGRYNIFLNNIEVENHIRSIGISNWVSPVAKLEAVRDKLVSQQQKIGNLQNVVMDGRDIGTVVFPDARLKLFVTATTEERARRRFLQMSKEDDSVSIEDVRLNLELRDKIDTTRKIGPLKPALDSVQIDNTNISEEECFQMVLTLVKMRFQ